MPKILRASSIFALVLALVTGCASSGRISNTALTEVKPLTLQGIATGKSGQRSDDVLFYLAFSGGGTRAAALSYGVLRELRDTRFTLGGKEKSLLDEVDSISSVSGGSFTAAYYGLFGERIFEDYEEVFLRRNVQRTLINGLLNPVNWIRMLFSRFNRTEMAIDYYDNNIFRGGTFADIAARHGPLILINATDLSIGERFSFTQQRFNLLCSQLADFKVARAVAASAAVPVAFAPIALKNYSGCDYQEPPWVEVARLNEQDNPRMDVFIKAYDSYMNKEQRPFIHLVDGGITDNLGVRALYDWIEILGGPAKVAELAGRRPKIIVVIVVNAQTRAARPMDLSSTAPSYTEVLKVASSAQLGRYNIESIVLMKKSLERWADELTTPEQKVIPYFIKLDFESIADEKARRIFNNMATSFSLPDEEVDNLIEAGHNLLRESPEYQQLLALIREVERRQRE